MGIFFKKIRQNCVREMTAIRQEQWSNGAHALLIRPNRPKLGKMLGLSGLRHLQSVP